MVLGRTVGPRAAGLLMDVHRWARPCPRPRPRPVVAPNPHASQELFISGDKQSKSATNMPLQSSIMQEFCTLAFVL